MRDVIILPTYNEAKNIEDSIRNVLSFVPQSHIVVVDDNSPDGTQDIVKRLQKEIPNLTLHARAKKEGLGEAYKDILMVLQKDPTVRTVFHMDADGSHDPKYLPELYRALEDHDLVFGSRYVKGGSVEGWEWWRIIISRMGQFYARHVSGLPLRDVSAGFIGMRKELLDKIPFEKFSGRGYAYLIEFKHVCIKTLGARFIEIPIYFLSRREGESKLTVGILIEGLKLPAQIRLKKLFPSIR